MRAGDGAALRRLCVRLSAVLRSDALGLMSLPVPMLAELAQDAKEAAKGLGKKHGI